MTFPGAPSPSKHAEANLVDGEETAASCVSQSLPASPPSGLQGEANKTQRPETEAENRVCNCMWDGGLGMNVPCG